MVSQNFLTNIKQKLINEKHNVLQKLLLKHDIDADGDETDEIQANIQIELQHKFAGLYKMKLARIEKALEKIENRTYGICVDCDDRIAEKRLLANPHCITCIACAEDREKEERQRKGF